MSSRAKLRREKLAALRSALRSATTSEELDVLFGRARSLLGERTSGATHADALRYVASYAGSEALTRNWLRVLVENSAATTLLARKAPLDRAVLERLLDLCVSRAFEKISWNGEIELIDALLEKGLELGESVASRCYELLMDPEAVQLDSRSALPWARLLIRSDAGVTNDMLTAAFRYILYKPEDTLRYLRHSAWRPGTWERCRREFPRVCELLLMGSSPPVVEALLDVIEGDDYREYVLQLGAANGPSAEVLARRLQDSSSPGLSLLTRSDCAALLQSPHAGVRLGAQLQLTRLAMSQTAKQGEWSVNPDTPGARRGQAC